MSTELELHRLIGEVKRWHAIRCNIDNRRRRIGARPLNLDTLPAIIQELTDYRSLLHEHLRTP